MPSYLHRNISFVPVCPVAFGRSHHHGTLHICRSYSPPNPAQPAAPPTDSPPPTPSDTPIPTELPSYEEYRRQMAAERAARVPQPLYRLPLETPEQAADALAQADALREALPEDTPHVFRVFAPDEDPRTAAARSERVRNEAREFRVSVMVRVLGRLGMLEGEEGVPPRVVLELALTRLVADREAWDRAVGNPPEVGGDVEKVVRMERCVELMSARPAVEASEEDGERGEERYLDEYGERSEGTSVILNEPVDDEDEEPTAADRDQDVFGLEDALGANLLFAAWELCTTHYSHITREPTLLASLAALQSPHTWFRRDGAPRRVVLHVGPTNSGKTYNCLEKLSNSPSGIYIAPARLLAWEARDRLHLDFATPCSLHAVHDDFVVRGAAHHAWAADAWAMREGGDGRGPVDVAVIDEGQDVGDEEHGWMMTQAIWGVECRELHVCMDPMAYEVVRGMVEDAGDEVDVIKYKRMAPLSLPERPFKGRVEEIRKGDCVVATSVQEVYRLRSRVDRHSTLRASVLHELMSSRSRRAQVEKFNRRENGVLISTEVVGMGFNLNISRILFWDIMKVDGARRRAFNHLELRQIAGRAGRYVSEFSRGEVCVRDTKFLKPVRGALAEAPDAVHTAPVLPPPRLLPHFRTLSSPSPAAAGDMFELTLDHLTHFVAAKHGAPSARYPTHQLGALRQRSRMLEGVALGAGARLWFATAPVDVEDPIESRAASMYAREFVGGDGDGVVGCGFDERILETPRSVRDLEDLASVVAVLKTYVWLSAVYPRRFADHKYAAELLEDAKRLLQDSA